MSDQPVDFDLKPVQNLDPLLNQYWARIEKGMAQTLGALEFYLQKYMVDNGLTKEEMAQRFSRETINETVDGRLKITWRVYLRQDKKDYLFCESSLTL